MKYIIPLTNLVFDKRYLKSFIDQRFLNDADLNALMSRKKWHNNIPVPEDIKQSFGEITNYLKDEILVLTLFPKFDIKIHADGAGTRMDNTYNVSINIPIENCTDDTVTKFWDFNDERKIEYIHYETLGTRDIKDKDDLTLHQSYVFKDQAVLFRNEYPHSVDNKCQQLRVMLSWRFKPEYSWEEAHQLCKLHHLL